MGRLKPYDHRGSIILQLRLGRQSYINAHNRRSQRGRETFSHGV